MDQTDCIVKVTDISSSANPTVDAHQELGYCGEIRSFIPFTADNETHFFVEFTSTEGFQTALNLDSSSTGLKICPISPNSRLLEQYRSVACFDRQRSSPYCEYISAQTKPTRGRRNSPGMGYGQPSSHFSNRTRSPLRCSTNLPRYPIRDEQTSSKSYNPPTRLPVSMRLDNTSHNLANVCASPTSIADRAGGATLPSVSAVGPEYTISSTIKLQLCGEHFDYDLTNLDQDPTGIICLLRETSCERGTWMIAAAYYRRSGNSEAAIGVLTSMITALKDQHIPETDLKPAYLLLAACEMDLSRRSVDTTASSKHHEKSISWLRQVYGANAPPSSSLPRRSTSLAGLKRQRELENVQHTLKDQLDRHRAYACRLEKRVQDLQKERDHAYRMESKSLKDVRLVGAQRRRAEDRAERERARRFQAEKLNDSIMARPLR